MPPAAREIRALIFDFDGTLADTMPLHWRAWRTVLERHGLRLTEERFYSLGGVPARDILRQLGREQGIPLDPHEAAREKVAAYVPLIPEIRPIAPVLAIARRHRGRLPLAIATGGTRWVIEKALRHLAIADWFDSLVTSEDVRRQKPAPDIYLEAARRLGVPPEHCRAYEDTDLGLEAIRAAGMEAVDVRKLRSGSP
jgi:beta-phosphoglucomutase-like phosphatase (HAD superfamily)